jgi:AraC-like DNA-binding protein
MLFEHIPAKEILFFIIYGITGAVSLIAALYLLLRRGNAIAPDVTPPVRLRRWAASFFIASVLGHVWWYLFLIYSCDIQSACYVVVAVVDCFGMLTTITGTLLAMLQDRKRPVWPVVAALTPYPIIGALYIVQPNNNYLTISIAYILLLYAIFTVYMVFAVRRYERWLNDNYADLENKKVWLSQVVSLVCLLLFILYTTVETDGIMIFILHIVELVLFGLLLWRVETLPSLETQPLPCREGHATSQDQEQTDELSTPLAIARGIGSDALSQIEQLLAEHCVETQLYLQHDLTLQQLAQTIGTNRYYLSQYFSRQGITYNTYINNLRINHFINRYQELAATGQPIVAQQLANESGYRSYSTFSLAFKQRTGQTVTAWIRESAE